MAKSVAACLILLGPVLAAAQSTLRFEAASVKLSVNPAPPLGVSGGPGTSDPTRITGHGVDLIRLLTIAYAPRIDDFDQISGPAWMSSEKYEILATVPPGATKTQAQEMWRNLLTERFHIETHWIKKEFPGYELVVARGGPKLQPSAEPTERRYLEVHPPNASRLSFRDTSMAELARRLGLPLSTFSGPGIAMGRVEDKTGLNGRYDFTLNFSGAMYPGGAFVTPTALTSLDEERDGPGLFDALQQQLGLRLVEKKLSLDVLVIDRADRIPTEN